jgi:hypothetical protein
MAERERKGRSGARAPRVGGAGGPSWARHVMRRREGRVADMWALQQAVVNLIQTQISNGIKLYSNLFKLRPLQKGPSRARKI